MFRMPEKIPRSWKVHVRLNMQPDSPKFPISISDAKPRSQHLKTHSTPHGCGQCEKAFALWSDLARHTSAVHRVGQPKFECDFPECKARFKRKDNLHRHKRRFHGSHETLDGPVSDIEPDVPSSETPGPRSTSDEEPETPFSLPTLFRAASEGNVAIVDMAGKSGLDFNSKGEDGCTVLHLAARAGRDIMVRKLFELGCSATARNSFIHTPLQEAILSHDEKTVATCLQYCVHTIDAQTLRMALESENPTIAQLLFRHIADIQKEVSMNTALYLTVKFGRLDVMEGLLQTSATHVDEVVIRGHNLLHTAAKYGHKEIIMALLARNMPINRGTSYQKTRALHFASRHGHIEATRLLLQHKDINPNVRLYQYNYSTPLIMASHQGHIEIAKLLLSHKDIDPNAQCKYDNKGPLHHASRGGFTEIVKLLLSHKDIDPNPKMQDIIFDTPLHFALREDHIEIARLLLSHKDIDPNTQNNLGDTPLHEAARIGNLEAVGLFLKQSFVNPNLQTTFGYTPLHYALAFDHVDVAKLLLAHDRLIIGQSSSGDFHQETVLEIAKRKGQTEIIEILESRQDV
jgi:ankyrin repeat protein